MIHKSAKPVLSREDVIKMMRVHRISPTQQRVDIAMVMLAKDQHFSAEEVLAKVNEQMDSVSKATVYNTLGLFAQRGLIREVVADPAKLYYDSNTTNHHHFYNVDTGELIDFDASHIVLGNLPELPSGTVAEGVDVVIRVRSK